jgi:hypothetical protein
MRRARKQRDLPLADIGVLEKQMSQKTVKRLLFRRIGTYGLEESSSRLEKQRA